MYNTLNKIVAALVIFAFALAIILIMQPMFVHSLVQLRPTGPLTTSAIIPISNPPSQGISNTSKLVVGVAFVLAALFALIGAVNMKHRLKRSPVRKKHKR
jgi:hypothetical protein